MTTKEKIVGLQSLQKKLASLRRMGKKIAFTNGCFDILHVGHVQYLESAKKENRVLIVGLNSDLSVKKIKGPHRPVNPQAARAAVLAALACVDYVTIFTEETPLKLISAIKPDILIKGADWKAKVIAGADVVKAYGGRIELIKYVQGFSSTNIIKSITSQCAQ